MPAPVPFCNWNKATISLAAAQTACFIHANAVPATSPPATNTAVNLTYRTAGTFSYLAFGVTSDRGALTATIELDSGGGVAPGNQTIITGASPSGKFKDTTHTDTIAVGTKVSVQVVNGSGGTVTALGAIGGVFAASGTTTVKLSCIYNFSGYSGTYYWPVVGALFNSTIESIANEQIPPSMDGTASDLYVRLASNAKTQSMVLRFRVGSANGNQTLTIPASTAGDFEDTTHTDTVTAGTNIDVQAVSTDNGAHGTGILSCEWNVTSGRGWIITSQGNANTSGLDRFPPGGSCMGPVSNTIYGECIPIGSVNSIKNLYVYVIASVASPASWTTCFNGTSTSLVVSLPSSSPAGLYADTTHIATPGAATDTVSTLTATGGANWAYNFISYELGGPADTTPISANDLVAFTEGQSIIVSPQNVTDAISFVDATTRQIVIYVNELLTFDDELLRIVSTFSGDLRNPFVTDQVFIQIQTIDPVSMNPIGSFKLNSTIPVTNPTFVERIISVSANTVIPIATGATVCVITPLQTSGATLTLKGAPTDVGLVIQPNEPTILNLTSAQAQFVLDSTPASTVTFTFL